MPTIFVISPETVPALADIQSSLAQSYRFVEIDKVESLANHREEKGVALTGGPPLKVAATLGMIRNAAPRLSAVVAVHREELDKLEPSIADLADVLVVPYTPLELRARMSAAMHLSELRHLIETSSQLDEVAELYNYQFFIKRLGQEISLAKRHLSPLTCVILNIQSYDIYMDMYGHSFAYNVVQQLARIIKEHIRGEDLAARLGGGEIAVLLPMSSEKGALSLALRLIKQVEELPVQVGDQTEHLAVKIGIAGYPSPDEPDLDPDTLIRYARHALHQARCSTNKKVQLFSEMKPFVG